ncbi:MAG: exopolyphosphatase, partial [Gammaproteobacteria bacterium]
MTGRTLLAAVDLGSNSFRLVIARVERHAGGRRIEALAGLKRTVRLAAGLRDDGMLDSASQKRGIEALAHFREHLNEFSPQAVRAVATNTLRVARNARNFLATAETALGFPIEVISGREEARLIYSGAAYSLPEDGRPRLVVDIGGGSTECIVGIDRQARVLESAPVGCVALSQRFFPEGSVDRASFEQARTLARSVFEPLAGAFAKHSWDYAMG